MTQPNPNSIATLWHDIRTHLDTKKRAVTLEIRAYPQPIAGCDAQIPALWEARDALVRDLNRLEAAAFNNTADAVESFIATSPCINDDQKQTFRAALREFRSAAPTYTAAE